MAFPHCFPNGFVTIIREAGGPLGVAFPSQTTLSFIMTPLRSLSTHRLAHTGALAMLAAAWLASPAKAETEGAAERPWSPLIEECVELENRLAHRLRTSSDDREAIRQLLATGDAALRSAAEPRFGTRWDPLLRADAAVREAADRLATSLLEEKETAVAAAIENLGIALPEDGQAIRIDPWASVDQECGFVPRDLGPVTTANGLCPSIPLGDLPQLIPSRYRLAEALGIGKNRFACAPRYIDPTLSHLPSSGRWNIQVLARLHCELVGRFNLASESGEPNTEAGAEETVRLVVVSQGRISAGSDMQEAAHEKVKFYRIEDSAASLALQHGGFGNPWVNEALPAAAAKRGWLLRPAAEHLDGGGDRGKSSVERALVQRLETLRAEVGARLRENATVQNRLRGLHQSLQSYAGHLRATSSVVDNSVPDSVAWAADDVEAAFGSVERLVADGHLDAELLSRIAPAITSTLESTQRALCVAGVPADQRGAAQRLAHKLERLDLWTRRP